MRSNLLFSAIVSLGSIASMGCSISAPDAPDAETSASSSRATAVVVVERTAGPGDTVRADSVIARFVRVQQGAVDDQALQIAGVAWDLPPLGTCSSTLGSPAPAGTLQPRSVDLLDVGVLTLAELEFPRQGSGTLPRGTVLLPRTMFDPTGGVSGVFYSARSTEAFAPSSRLQLRTSGGPDLPDGFLANVVAPREITEVRVTAKRGAGALWNGLDVAWSWSTSDAAETDDALGARDLIYVDVLTSSGRLVARCPTTDAGHLVIPASALSGSTDEGQVAVHRLHRESFKTKGIEPGEVRFDVARVVNFRR